ncbi:MAG: threonine/serine dehydratase, partial [Candidatus Sulfotelmatobacter sp.]
MVTLPDVQAAERRIRESIYLSPCARSEAFSRLTGSSVYFKFDNQQKTGAFKERGALNKLLSLTAAERAQGVIAASAGNHAQGLAYHAGQRGIRAQIYMPFTTPLTKVSNTKGYGADVVLHGTDYDAAYEAALERSRRDHLVFVHAFDDDSVIAGQGTIGLEILKDLPEVEAVFAPVGGGGLISGVAAAIKLTNPKIKVIGVEPELAADAQASLRAGKIVQWPAEQVSRTLADGLRTQSIGDIN